MSTTTIEQQTSPRTSATVRMNESVIAMYSSHTEAEDAVHKLKRGGIPLERISIIGRNFQVREDIQGYYRPSDAVKEGAGFGAWFGGLFGLLAGFGLFVFPVVGPLIVLGPLAGLIAGAATGAGIGALVSGLMAMGVSKEEALKYKSRVEAGEFLVTVIGSPEEIETARGILEATGHVGLETHRKAA
jgi:uncharacterized membrane protein